MAENPDEFGEYSCSRCGMPGYLCLNEMNRIGQRCCWACGFGDLHGHVA